MLHRVFKHASLTDTATEQGDGMGGGDAGGSAVTMLGKPVSQISARSSVDYERYERLRLGLRR